MKQAPPQPPHTWGPAAATLHWKKTRFRAPASSPKQTKMQHSCSHYNAFCSIAWQTGISLRTWQQNVTPTMQPFHCDPQPPLPKHPKTRTNEQPPVAEHTGRTDLTMKRVQPHPPHTCEVPFIAGCSHFTQKNTRFRAPASSPKQPPRNIHAVMTMRFATTASKTP